MDFGLIRTIQGDMILSPSMPRLGIRINPDYIYLGDLQYILRNTQHVEEFIFLCPSALGHVTRMLLVRFEGFLESKQGEYTLPDNRTVRLDNEDYFYDTLFIDLQEYLNRFPDSDIAHAADYIRQRAYTLAGDFIYQRFLRVVSGDRRYQFVIAFLERNDEAAQTPDIIQQDASAAQELLDRALTSFTILHETN